MRLPDARGPLGEQVHALLRSDPATARREAVRDRRDEPEEDAALTLWVLHELHYRGFDDVDDAWEWAPALMDVRHRLEHDLEQRLRTRFAQSGTEVGSEVVESVRRVVAADDGPSLARHLQRHGTREQALALLRQRSLYHLKEADPTSWVLPRLQAAPKAALAEVQYDEYGAGDPARLHQHLFARGLRAAGLDATYGSYVDEADVTVLEQNNAGSLIGLHRRLRGVALGHFAAFEATSSVPSRQLAQGLRRLGLADDMAAYYDEHVEADAVHEHLALAGVCAALVAAEPELLADVVLGAWTCLDLESRTAARLLGQWQAA